MLSENYRSALEGIFAVGIIVVSTVLIERFIPSLLWAAIILVMTYPIYEKWHEACQYSDTWASLSFTTFVTIVILAPLLWLLFEVVQDIKIFVDYIVSVNKDGMQAPDALAALPKVGKEVEKFWLSHFSQPGGLKNYLSSLNIDIAAFSYYAKAIGVSLVKRSVQVGFTILCLFFFYRDVDPLISQVNKVGSRCFGDHWQSFAYQLPNTLQGTVHGTVLVGMGVGLIMGIVYWLLGFPAPTLAAFFTGLAAMIPFVVPIVFLFVALVIWLSGSLLKAFILCVIGTVVMFIADHFVKPVLIGGTTRLPFLAVLFGLLGGVETLGLIGLFLGPMIMVLFMTLWRQLAE